MTNITHKMNVAPRRVVRFLIALFSSCDFVGSPESAAWRDAVRSRLVRSWTALSFSKPLKDQPRNKMDDKDNESGMK